MSNNADNPIKSAPKPASYWYCLAALLLWLVSLLLPGIIMPTDHASLYGYEVLLEGWLSPIAGNIAWFANPLFLIAVLKILNGQPAPVLALAAAILGCDSFRFSELPSSVQVTPIYGLGWGAIVWLAALLLMLAAAGARQYEMRSTIWWKDRGFEWLKPVALVSLIVLISATAYMAINERVNSPSLGEAKQPSGLAVKR